MTALDSSETGGLGLDLSGSVPGLSRVCPGSVPDFSGVSFRAKKTSSGRSISMVLTSSFPHSYAFL